MTAVRYKACAHCTREFKPKRRSQTYCTPSCRNAGRWKRYEQEHQICDDGRICLACRKFLPWGAFDLGGGGKRPHKSRCRDCRAAQDAARRLPIECSECGATFQRRGSSRLQHCSVECSRAAERRKARMYWLRDRYGVTLDWYDETFTAQGGRCAICKEPGGPDEPLNVDHRHSDGLVRGLLCGNCNRGLGLLRDDVELLWSAVEYILQAELVPA